MNKGGLSQKGMLLTFWDNLEFVYEVATSFKSLERSGYPQANERSHCLLCTSFRDTLTSLNTSLKNQ
jgi:hypothetical protein